MMSSCTYTQKMCTPNYNSTLSFQYYVIIIQNIHDHKMLQSNLEDLKSYLNEAKKKVQSQKALKTFPLKEIQNVCKMHSNNSPKKC